MPAARTPLLETHALTVTMGSRTLAHDLNLQVRGGDRLAILGRNGAGKSTLLTTLAGLRLPTGGQVSLDGLPLLRWQPRALARRRGWLGQSQSDPFAATVLETVLTGRHPHLERWQWETPEDRLLAQAALASMGLAGFESRPVQSLSGGERQRLAIATLITQAPAVYLLDEPLAHLDLNHQIAVLDYFARLAREQNAAVVMVLHDPGLAARYCNLALLLQGDGETRWGDADTLLTGAHLSELYAYPLRELRDGRERWFIPA